MRRLASHYIWYKEKVYRLHYLEIDNRNCLKGIFPLTEEIPGTEFYDGVLIPIPCGDDPGKESLLREWCRFTGKIKHDTPVQIFHLSGIDQASAKLGTDDGSGRCHIERL